MSWHGSLTCSYCYERGHTRRKCPEMKKRHDTYAERLANGTESEAEWYERSAYREYKQQQEGLKESNKQCAFCGKSGHRVNTCPDRLKVVQQLKEIDEWFVPFARQVLDDLGMGVGTMLPWSGYINGEYKTDIPVIITGMSGHEAVGGLSVINLWESDWFRPEVTNALSMQKQTIHMPMEFGFNLYKRLYDFFGVEGWDFTTSAYNEPNRTIRYENKFVDALGSPPRHSDSVVISPMASSFEEDAAKMTFTWNFEQKRQVNRLFRDTNNALIKERLRYRIEQLHTVLKERGVI